MARILDSLALTADALVELAGREPGRFLAILGFALLSAGLSWALLTHSALLWNKSFAPKAARHPLCALAALSTLCAVPLSVGAAYTGPFVEHVLAKWARENLENPQWQDAAIDRAGEIMRRLGTEPSPPPREARCLPLTTAAAREAAAAAYAAAAAESFSRACPRLNSLLAISPTATAQALSADMKSFFDSTPGLYPAARLKEVIVHCWIETTGRSWGEFVRRLQLFPVLLLLFLHLGAFGLVGWSGYCEIRTGRRDGMR